MSDDRRATAVAMPGEPAGWRATLRDLLRYLRTESPDREAALEWLREAATGDESTDGAEATAADQLAFLEDTGIVASAEAGPQPGPYGREFLDTHDEGVLYDALAGSVAGFEPLLESLAVRPLTDVEFGDLLEREFDADPGEVDPTAHRRWLEALGYLEHDGGVNDLTRTGRLRVETDDALTPPRANSGGGAASAGGATGAGGGASVGGGASTSGAASAGDAAGSGDEVQTQANSADERVDSPSNQSSTRRGDTRTGADGVDGFEDLLERYDHTCAVCGDRRQRSPGEGYARVHHPMPTDEAHGGPAEPANAVVVCPNHRADFEFGLLTVDPRSLEVDHAYESAVSGRTLATVDGHEPGAEYLAYHDQVVAEF